MHINAKVHDFLISVKYVIFSIVSKNCFKIVNMLVSVEYLGHTFSIHSKTQASCSQHWFGYYFSRKERSFDRIVFLKKKCMEKRIFGMDLISNQSCFRKAYFVNFNSFPCKACFHHFFCQKCQISWCCQME